MKKFALFSAIALTLGVTSCINDNDHKMETTYNVRTYSLVTDSKGNSTVSTTIYSFLMDGINATCTVGINNLTLDGVSTTANTKVLPFVGRNVSIGGQDASGSDKWGAACYLMEAQNATAEGGRAITNFMGDITTASNTLNPILIGVNGSGGKLRDQLAIDPILYPGGSPMNSIYTETQYNLEDYHVMTFWCDMLYTGTTNKVNTGTMNSEEDKNGVIRVYLNLEKASDYKATVYFYNFKRTATPDDDESGQAMVQTVDFKLADIPVTFDRNGFTLQGDNLVPVTLKDKKELPEYTMGGFLLNSTKNMTGIMCRFSLPDNIRVSFDGQGLYGYNISDFNNQ